MTYRNNRICTQVCTYNASDPCKWPPCESSGKTCCYDCAYEHKQTKECIESWDLRNNYATSSADQYFVYLMLRIKYKKCGKGRKRNGMPN